MDSNQTLHLKPMYPHSHISLYNAPVLSATVPSLSLASGLSIVSVANGSTNVNTEINNLDALATIQAAAASSNSAQLVPMTANNVCLDGIQIQQIQMHQQSLTQCNRIGNIGQQTGQLLQIQITSAPTLASPTLTCGSDLQSSSTNTNGSDVTQITLGRNRNSNNNINPDTISNLSDGSSSSETSTLSEANNSELNSSSFSKNSALIKKDMDFTGTNYVNLAKASCSSSGSAVSMKLSSSDGSFASLKSNGVKGFKCQICDRDFTQKGNLKTHLMTHSGERPYECQTCGKNFTQKGNLDTHVKIHTETKDHKCQYCDRGFTQRGNLKTHIRSIHTKEKPYACGHCGKAFSQKGNMLTHYRTHDKQARFPCNVCGKTFSQKGNLKTHQQRHGRNSGR